MQTAIDNSMTEKFGEDWNSVIPLMDQTTDFEDKYTITVRDEDFDGKWDHEYVYGADGELIYTGDVTPPDTNNNGDTLEPPCTDDCACFGICGDDGIGDDGSSGGGTGTGTQETGCVGTQCPICGGYIVSKNGAIKVISADTSGSSCPACICPLPKDPITDKQSALTIIGSFESNNKTTSVFKEIPKKAFINDLKLIISNPTENIDQKNDGTCGAAVLMKFLIDQNPLTFTQMALGLYQNGTYTKNGLTISATQNMKNNSAIYLSEVNTIIQGSITNSNNMFQDYNPNTDGSGLSSFTYPAFMYNFLTAFSDQQISTKNIVSTQFLQNINLNSNYVIAEVHLDSNYHLSTGAVANHYLQVIDDQNSTLQFWSWGTDENYSQLTDDFLNGIHELFIIPKR